MLLKGTSQVLLPLLARSFDFGRTVWKNVCSCCKGVSTIIIKPAANTECQASIFMNWGCSEKFLLEWTTKASSLGRNTVNEVTEMVYTSCQNNPQALHLQKKIKLYFAQKKHSLQKQHSSLRIRGRILADAQNVSFVHVSPLCTP